jgi:hypothetical protein
VQANDKTKINNIKKLWTRADGTLYGWLCHPIMDSQLKELFSFEFIVILLSLILMLLIFFQASGNSFLNLLLQDTGLIILSIPFYLVLADLLKLGPDQSKYPILSFLVIIIFTIATINLNDWKKLKEAST